MLIQTPTILQSPIDTIAALTKILIGTLIKSPTSTPTPETVNSLIISPTPPSIQISNDDIILLLARAPSIQMSSDDTILLSIILPLLTIING